VTHAVCFEQEDKSRVDLFGNYAAKNKVNLFELFFPLLHDEDLFISHQAGYHLHCPSARSLYYESAASWVKKVGWAAGS